MSNVDRRPSGGEPGTFPLLVTAAEKEKKGLGRLHMTGRVRLLLYCKKFLFFFQFFF